MSYELVYLIFLSLLHLSLMFSIPFLLPPQFGSQRSEVIGGNAENGERGKSHRRYTGGGRR